MKTFSIPAIVFLLFFGLVLFANADQKPVGANSRVVTVQAPKGCEPVTAKIDAHGTIHLVSNSSEGPQYSKSMDGGKTFETPLQVLDDAVRKPGLIFDVWDMAVSPSGHVHIALGTNAWKLKLPKDEWGFYYASLKPNGTQFSPVRNLNHQPSEGFSLAVTGQGKVTACWLADKLYANVSLDDGQNFGPKIEIDPAFNPCDCCTTTATYGSDGRLAILYREETNNERDMYVVLWDQETSKVTRERVSNISWKKNSCPMTYYGIIPQGDGYLAIWPTETTIYFNRLNSNGAPRVPKEIKTAGVTGMRTGMFILPGTDGQTLVGWKKDDQLGWQLFDQKARPIGRPESAKSSGKGAAGVVDQAGNFVLIR